MIEKLASDVGGRMTTGASGAFGPVVVRRRLGATLRRLREDANMRLEQVAAELEVSSSKISRLETGHSVPKTWDVRNLLSVYGLDDADRRGEILRWVEESKAVGWWHPYSEASPTDLDYYISLESEAASVYHFCPLIPSLMQTGDYARAILKKMMADTEGLSDSEISGLVDVRLGRQAILTRPVKPVKFNVVLDESALLRTVGDADITRNQLESLLRPMQAVELRVRPMSAPVRLYSAGPFTIFIPRLSAIDYPVVNLEAAGRDYYLEESSDIIEYQTAFEILSNDSLSPSESLELIRNLIS